MDEVIVQKSEPTRPEDTGRRILTVAFSSFGLGILVLLGISVRAVMYAADRSLTLDEAFVALNLHRKSGRALLGELDWNSAAPPGFLEFEKLVSKLFGESEPVLRSPSFAAGLLSLIAFAMLARRVLTRSAVPVAVLVFVGAVYGSTYSAILKPYAFDVLFVPLLTITTLAVLHSERGCWRPLLLVALGVVAIAFSYASVFTIAGSATVLVADAVVRRDPGKARRTALVVGSWLAVLAITFLAHGETLAHLRQSFASEGSASQTVRKGMGALRVAIGLAPQTAGIRAPFAVLATICFVVLISIGAVHAVRRSWQPAFLLLLPLLFVFVVVAAGWYPPFARTMLFLAPALAIFLAEGFTALLVSSTIARAVATLLLIVVVVAEAAATAKAVGDLRSDTGMKPIMNVLATRARPSDTVYLGYASQYAFAYYMECGCVNAATRRAIRRWRPDLVSVQGSVAQWSPALAPRSSRFRVGEFHGYNLKGYLADFTRFPPHSRVWVVMSFLHSSERRTLLRQLNKRGTRRDAYVTGDGVDADNIYLYRF